MHIHNKRKYIFLLGEGPIWRLDDATWRAEPIYPIKFAQPNKRFVLSLHYNGVSGFFFVNATKTY